MEKVEEQYKLADEYVILHEDDPKLNTIRIPLPKPPKLSEIDGYGLPAQYQMFQREEMPRRLIALQKRKKDSQPLSVEEMHSELQDNQEKYREEILWIKKQWKRRLYGYWFFNNGVPTYIDGWHYVYLNNWYIGAEFGDGYPEYRDRDRRWFHACRYFYNHPKYYGISYPKHRREGATFRSQCVGYCIVTEGLKRQGGIQSKSEGDAKKVFKDKLREPWKKMWFFWKPIHNGSTDPAAAIEFLPDAKKVKGKTLFDAGVDTLEGRIDFNSSGDMAYDGDKKHFMHHDEVGKKEKGSTYNVEERWNVAKQCLSTGNGANIFGFALLTSTVEEMDNGGGKEFWEIAKKSMYGDVNKVTGQTKSGLANIFFPAYDGLEGYVDMYGMSVIEDPTEPTYDARGKLIEIGAKRALLSEFEALKKAQAWNSLASLKRKFPMKFMDCFTKSGKDSQFNMHILNRRIDELEGKPPISKGDLEWRNGVFQSQVEFIPNPEYGRFSISEFPELAFQNSVMYDGFENTFKFQRLNVFVTSADPVKFKKAGDGRSRSNGGGAAFRLRDYNIDPENTPTTQMKTNKFKITYNNEVYDKKEYKDDMLKMSWYCSGPMYSERNVTDINDYFQDNKCDGLLLYDQNDVGVKEKEAGFYTSDPVKESLFGETMQYIQLFGLNEDHIEYLEECRSINGVEDMTNYDLFTACGGCHLARKNRVIRRYEEPVEDDVVIPINFRYA